MIELCKVEDKDLTKFFLADLTYAQEVLPDEELEWLNTHKEYKNIFQAKIEGLMKDNELIGFFVWNYCTSISVTCHFYIKRKYHGTEMGKTVCLFLFSFLKNFGIDKVIVMIPEPCKHAYKAAIKYGFLINGFIEKVTTWRNKTVGITIMSKDL